MNRKRRDSLIEKNLDLARLVSRSVAAASPHFGAPISELEGDAFYLLVLAAENFRPSRGLAFRQWALWFISRRLRDGLRRKALKDGSHNQLPDDFDIEALDASPEDGAARIELRRQVREAVAELEPRSRAIVTYRYRDELSYPAVGERIELRASRVGQLHGLALQELKGKLNHLQSQAAALMTAK